MNSATPSIRNGCILLCLALIGGEAAIYNRVYSLDNFKCMDVEDGGTNHGSKIQVFSCDMNRNQMFLFEEASPGRFRIRNELSGRCLGVRGASHRFGANVELQTCNDERHQLFRVEEGMLKDRRIIATHSNRCLYLRRGRHRRTDENDYIIQWPCGRGYANEIWLCFDSATATGSGVPSSTQDSTVLFATDTMIRDANPDTSYGDEVDITVDLEDKGAQTQALLKFEELSMGNLTVLKSAKLSIFTTSHTGSAVSAHRMIAPWDSATTWNSLGGDGVQTDGIEAETSPSFSFANPTEGSVLEIDVTEDVRFWLQQSETANEGWVFLPSSTDGWDFESAESKDPHRIPRLLLYSETPAENVISVDQGSRDRIRIDGQCYTELFNVNRSMNPEERSIFCTSFLLALNSIIDDQRCRYEISLCDVDDQAVSDGDFNDSDNPFPKGAAATAASDDDDDRRRELRGSGEGASNNEQDGFRRRRRELIVDREDLVERLRKNKKRRNKVKTKNSGVCNAVCRDETLFREVEARKLGRDEQEGQAQHQRRKQEEEEERRPGRISAATTDDIYMAASSESSNGDTVSRRMQHMSSSSLSPDAINFCGALVRTFSEQTDLEAFHKMEAVIVSCGNRVLIACEKSDAPSNWRDYNFLPKDS